MKYIKRDTVNDLFYTVCRTIYATPEYEIIQKGKKFKELLNPVLVLTNPRDRIITLKSRSLSLKYLSGELAFYFSGSNKLKFIAHYSKFWNKISDDGVTVNSCYGKKLLHDLNRKKITQFNYAKERLLMNSNSKRAVMTIYDKHSANIKTKDAPCTMFLQFIIRNNKLHLITHMRSNDVWFGLTYDIPFFTIIQELMLITLKTKYKELTLGKYTHISGSLHIYEKDFSKIDKVLSTQETFSFTPLPNLTVTTMKEMSIFLHNEKIYRTKANNLKEEILTDPFLIQLQKYLKEKT